VCQSAEKFLSVGRGPINEGIGTVIGDDDWLRARPFANQVLVDLAELERRLVFCPTFVLFV